VSGKHGCSAAFYGSDDILVRRQVRYERSSVCNRLDGSQVVRALLSFCQPTRLSNVCNQYRDEFKVREHRWQALQRLSAWLLLLLRRRTP